MRKEAPEAEKSKAKTEDSDTKNKVAEFKKEIERLQREKTEEVEKRKIAEKDRDNMRQAKELIEKEVVELLHEKQGYTTPHLLSCTHNTATTITTMP